MVVFCIALKGQVNQVISFLFPPLPFFSILSVYCFPSLYQWRLGKTQLLPILFCVIYSFSFFHFRSPLHFFISFSMLQKIREDSKPLPIILNVCYLTFLFPFFHLSFPTSLFCALVLCCSDEFVNQEKSFRVSSCSFSIFRSLFFLSFPILVQIKKSSQLLPIFLTVIYDFYFFLYFVPYFTFFLLFLLYTLED